MLIRIFVFIFACISYLALNRITYSQSMTPVNNQNSINNSTNPSISNNKKVAVKYINAAKIINNNNYDENYYPDNTLPSKTNNTLLIGSAILIGSGVSLLEMSSIAKYLRIFLSKLSFGQYLFRFINKIL